MSVSSDTWATGSSIEATWPAMRKQMADARSLYPADAPLPDCSTCSRAVGLQPHPTDSPCNVQVATTSGYAYYVLGVPGGAPMHVVRRAYTDLLLQAHPETAQDGGSLARLMEVTLLAHVGAPLHVTWHARLQCCLHVVGTHQNIDVAPALMLSLRRHY